MILNTLAAAMMLLWVNFTPTVSQENTVELSACEAPVSTFSTTMKMTSETEQTLIEDHAAPHWSLTVPEAWAVYQLGLMTIKEIVPDSVYTIYYDDSHIDVLLENNA